jgi:hypothetical protein
VLPFSGLERELDASIFRVGEGTGCFHFQGGRGNWMLPFSVWERELGTSILGLERELGASIFRVGEKTG